MTIDILICTYNDGIEKIPSLLLPFKDSIFYKISHQITDKKFATIPSELLRKDIQISQVYSKGLSINRNNALSMASSDICFIADDDVSYNLSYLEIIKSHYENNPDIDLFVGKIKTGGKDYKKYDIKEKSINWINVGSISSIEITFRRKSIQNNDIVFDKNFGINGLIFSKGEEVIFLSDCLKKQLKIKFIPIYMVEHPYENTGRGVPYNENEAVYWGALIRRIFGGLSYLFSIPLAIKHYNRYRKNISIKSFLYYFYKGINTYKLNEKFIR